MIMKVMATQVFVSKGFENAPALHFGEKGDFVRFRIGAKIYDTRAENNARWMNLSVKAFGPVCDRIRKMNLKEGSCVNLIGRLDEDTWTDQKTNEQKSATVIILDEIEYASSSNGKNRENNQTSTVQNGYNAPAPTPPEASPNFTGYQNFGGAPMFEMG